MEILKKNRRIKIPKHFVNVLVKFPILRVLLKIYSKKCAIEYCIAVKEFDTLRKEFIDTKARKDYPYITLEEWKNHFYFCAINYGATAMDYIHLEMYKQSELVLNTYITSFHQWHDIIPSLNGDYYGETTKPFRDKDIFAERFGDLLGREFLIFNKNIAFSDFEKFLLKHEKVVIKPRSGSCQGDGIYVAFEQEYSTELQRRNMYEKLKDQDVILEQFLRQDGITHDLNPLTVNTVRIITFLYQGQVEILLASLKIGNGNTFVDNICKGGMKAPIDLKTGIISGPALDEYNNRYLIHPYSGLTIIGQKLPNWEKTIEMVKEAAVRIPEVPFVGWDVAVGENGSFLVEGNQGSSIQDFEYPWEYGYFDKIQEYALKLTGKAINM